MGQYYKPVNTKTNQYLESWDYGTGAKLMEHSWGKNDFVGAVESLLMPEGNWYKAPIVWAGDYADDTLGLLDEDKNETNFYGFVTEKIQPRGTVVKAKYLYNHTKKEFVNKSKTPNNDGWQIHPLPLLTCESNGRGGGDFNREDPNNLVGSWCNDIISVESRKPTKKMGFTELVFDLKED